jgi:capsular polysaccharide transport system permease protein
MTTPIKSQRFRLRRSRGPGGEDGAVPASQAAMPQDDAPEKPIAAISVRKRASDTAYSGPSGLLLDEDAADLVREKARPTDPAPVVVETKTTIVAPAPNKASNSPTTQQHTIDLGAGAFQGTLAPVEQPPTPAAAPGGDQTTRDLAGIEAENLTARQLRMAMRVAQKHGVRANSAHEAVLLLRQRGIDPFARSTLLDLVGDQPPPGQAVALRPGTAVGAPVNPDDDPTNVAQSRMAEMAAQREKEIKRVQREIAKRRRKRLILLGTRLLAFVTLPTFIVTWYFYMIATPMYATNSEFVIQQADSMANMGAMQGMMPSAAGLGLGGQSEATSVQSFLQSRGAMIRLNEEEGFISHFSDPTLDLWRRLPEGASLEQAFKTYSRHVQIAYDPTDGVIRMEVIAATPQDSERFARALIRYAEEHVDMMTQRLRDSQMREARQMLDEAQENLLAARRAAVELQERSAVMSGEVELSLLSQRLISLETELSQARLSLQELRSNLRPNPARLQQLERREAALASEITDLRATMTQGLDSGTSLARIQSELIMAEAEVQTREMMRANAMQQMESARMEVSRQVRYLAMSVEPIAQDEATYPRKLENSTVAFLAFLGLYLFMSMTISVLREQVSG